MRRYLYSAVVFIIFILLLPYIFRLLGIILLIAAGYILLSRFGIIGQGRSDRYYDHDDHDNEWSSRQSSGGRSSDLRSDDDDLIRSDMDAEVITLPESALRKDGESR